MIDPKQLPIFRAGRPTYPIGAADAVKHVEVKPADVQFRRCPGCGDPMSVRAVRESLWGECPRCENDRVEDAWSG